MAWRIDEAVIRGELDNCTRGRVTGRIWFVGRDEPVALELTGDCHRDVAGRRLEFSNPDPRPADLGKFSAVQRGTVGDITASRKVRVPDIPLEKIGEYYESGKPFPWHWGNSLYLEWYSERNGRVVIESASYELRIVGDPAWEMTPAEEERQRTANAGAMDGFMTRLAEAAADKMEAEAAARAADETDDEDAPAADEDPLAEPADGAAENDADAAPPFDLDDDIEHLPPLTEEEAEQMQERSDLLADRIAVRVAREGIEQYARILEEEIARLARERGDPEPTPEQRERNRRWLEELDEAAAALEAEKSLRGAADAADDDTSDDELGTDGEPGGTDDADSPAADADPAAEPSSAKRSRGGRRRGGDDADADWLDDESHPLAARAQALTMRIISEPEEKGWLAADSPEEHPVAELIGSVMKAGVKVGGALDGEDWPPPAFYAASILVRLKRARGFYDDALRAADDCRDQRLTEAAWLADVRDEIEQLAAAVDERIAELREILKRAEGE